MVFDKYTDSETLSRIVDYDSVSQMWRHCVQSYSELPAIVDGQTYSFSQLDTLVGSFRGLLSESGIGRASRVGILLPNCVDLVKVYLAVTTLGAVAVLLPPHLDENAVFGCCMKFSLDAIVSGEGLEERCSLAGSRKADLKVISCSGNAAYAEDAEVSPSEPCVVLFTGGTTGRSKGALLSNRAIMAGTRNGCYGYRDVFHQRYFLVLPLTHVFGLVRNLMTSLYTGSCLYICRNTKNMFKEIPSFKPTVMVLVPALAELGLTLSRQLGRNMLGSELKYIICGAATVAPYLVREYAALGVTLLPGYGLTESANLVSGNPESMKNPEAVGFVYPNLETRLVDGELWIRGENVFDGYLGDEEETEKAFSDGWFKTGDLARFDEEGMLHITGRTKEIIVLPTGENISPAELEARFNEIDGIQDCLVSEQNGGLVLEVLPRKIVLGEVQDIPAYLTEKIQAVNQSLPSFARIGMIRFRDKDFARTPSMKILRKQPQ